MELIRRMWLSGRRLWGSITRGHLPASPRRRAPLQARVILVPRPATTAATLVLLTTSCVWGSQGRRGPLLLSGSLGLAENPHHERKSTPSPAGSAPWQRRRGRRMRIFFSARPWRGAGGPRDRRAQKKSATHCWASMRILGQRGTRCFFSRSRPRPALLSVNRAAVDGGHVVTNGYRWLFATAPPAYLAMVTVRLTGIARAAVGLRRTKAGAGAGRFTGAGPPAELHRRRPLRLRQRGSRLR